MRLRLEAKERLSLEASPPAGNWETVYCGICRTDAKLFYEGQRDLALPRVPGHEAVYRNRTNGLHALAWPAKSCGQCRWCQSGRENLCESIRIMGFHQDGAWDRYPDLEGLELSTLPEPVRVGPDSMVTPAVAPGDIGDRLKELPWPALFSLAEPLGCVCTAFLATRPEPGSTLLIVGGGVLGMLAAIRARSLGLAVSILEKNQAKLRLIQPLAAHLGVSCFKQTDGSGYDLVLPACADPLAFATAMGKLRKSGLLIYFSGLTKNEQLGSNLLNLAHYRELRLQGSYGLTREGLAQAVEALVDQPGLYASCIQRLISLEEVPHYLPAVWKGETLKLVIDFTRTKEKSIPAAPVTLGLDTGDTVCCNTGLPGWLGGCSARLPDAEILARARFLMDNKTKPLGSLGRLEDMAVRVCGIQGSLAPRTDRRWMLVFAADHGLVEEGVSAYPQEVTRQMLRNFAEGGAAINVLCRQYGHELRVLDVGVKGDTGPLPLVVNVKVAQGTANSALGPAMSDCELDEALLAGASQVRELGNAGDIDLVGLGEMGIGNTSAATLLIAARTGLDLADLVGRGTGVDDEQLAHKRKVLDKVFSLHELDRCSAREALRRVGGLEIAAMTGAALAAASAGIPVVLDGLISTAAGLLAEELLPGVRHSMIIGHRSVEPAQQAAAAKLGLEPVLDLGMRLGEGSGAAITMGLLETACRILNEMASFDSAGVSTRN